ncbi:MAG: hypothetical protein M3P93_00015, partial [Actinomycetota bacterium]|nr:hypothetical protein [Actinomycetota bacterium]
MDRYVVFGAAGDLVTRHLLPALALLVERGRLPPSLDVVGIGREPLSGPDYRALATARLAQHAAHVDGAARHDLVERLDFVRADLSDDVAAAAALAPVVGRAPVARSQGSSLRSCTRAGWATTTIR